MNILVLNCGSSSVKFQLIATDLDRIVQNQDERLARGVFTQDGAAKIGVSIIVERGNLQRMFDALLERGYRVIGPIALDGAISYDEMTSVADLPE